MTKERIDILLVEKGLIESREKAKRIIMEGAVYIDSQRVDKPGEKVDIDSNIIVKGNPIPYVSRGGLKLEKAIEVFGINLKDKIALDIGASTGGFTDCMLKNNASKVYAIDVGYGQLDWKLRNDSRVVVKERTNIRHMKENDIGEKADFSSIDVSFISLKLVLPVAKNLLKDDGEIVALIKPQFEAGRDKVGKKGIIKDSKVHKDVIRDIYDFCSSIDLFINNITFSPIKGTTGNIEYLAHINKDSGIDKNNIDSIINTVVSESHLML